MFAANALVTRVWRWRQRSRALYENVLYTRLIRTRVFDSIRFVFDIFVNGLISVYIQIFTPTFDTYSCIPLRSTIKYLQNIKIVRHCSPILIFCSFYFCISSHFSIWTWLKLNCKWIGCGRLIFLFHQIKIAIKKVKLISFSLDLNFFRFHFLRNPFNSIASTCLCLQPPQLQFDKFICLWEKSLHSIAYDFRFALLKWFSWRFNLHICAS